MKNTDSNIDTNTNKYNKLIALSVTIIAICTSAILIYIALKNNSIYYYSPSDFQREINKQDSKIKNNTLIRLGGLVAKNSLIKKNNSIFFSLSDGKTRIDIKYNGVLPDLFKENAGAIVEGIYNQNYKQNPNQPFPATKVLAKHDENYKPPANYHDNTQPISVDKKQQQ